MTIFVLQIVTYETTKEDGIVEILTETKSASPMASSKVAGKNSSKKSDGTVTPTNVVSAVRAPASEVVIKQESTDVAAAPPPRRRPLPMLIPIVDKQQQQQQRNPPTIIRLPRPTDDTTDAKLSFAGQITVGDLASSAVATAENGDQTDNSMATEHNQQQQHLFVDTSTTDVGRRSSSSAGSSSAASPKSKTASFFDKLKAQVDETVNLTCPVCRHESKCLSEYMRHKLTHKNVSDDEYDDVDDVDAEDVDDDDEDDVVTAGPTVVPAARIEAAVDRRPCVFNGGGSSSRSPPPVTAAELKSTRCQRCRKRCKTSTELVTHLATCWGPPSTVKNPAAAVTSNAPTKAGQIELDDDGRRTEKDEQQQQRHHPMENKIFVWNTPVVGVLPHEKYGEGGRPLPPLVAVSDSVVKRPFKIVEMPPRVHLHNPPLPPLTAISSRRPDNRNATTSEPSVSTSTPHQSPQQQQQQIISVRKEGKMYKTVSFILLQLILFLDIV